MHPQHFITFVIAVGLPIAWLASEFQSRRWLRILLGSLSLIACVSITALGVNLYDRLSYNAWYGFASRDLIDTTITEIEGGRTDKLLPALRKLRDEFHPTYENRAHYDDRIRGFVEDVKAAGPKEE